MRRAPAASRKVLARQAGTRQKRVWKAKKRGADIGARNGRQARMDYRNAFDLGSVAVINDGSRGIGERSWRMRSQNNPRRPRPGRSWPRRLKNRRSRASMRPQWRWT
jgi:hypothetical protein